MVALVLDAPVRPARTGTRPVVRVQHPLPLPHPPESMIGTPYYDDEFEMAQSIAHMHTIYSVGPLLTRVSPVPTLTLRPGVQGVIGGLGFSEPGREGFEGNAGKGGHVAVLAGMAATN